MLTCLHATKCRSTAKGGKQTSKKLSCKLATWTTCKLVASGIKLSCVGSIKCMDALMQVTCNKKHSRPVTAFLLYTCKASLLSARKFASWQSFWHACLRSNPIACQSCELATQLLAMLANMHPSHFLKVKTRPKKRYK